MLESTSNEIVVLLSLPPLLGDQKVVVEGPSSLVAVELFMDHLEQL